MRYEDFRAAFMGALSPGRLGRWAVPRSSDDLVFLAHRQQTVRAGADAVREWLEFGTDPESTSDARTALFVARRPRQAAVERWGRICAGLEQRPVALRLLTRARRKLALRRWELQRVCTTHALLHLVRAPICLRVHPFVEDVSRCAAAAEVAVTLREGAWLGRRCCR